MRKKYKWKVILRLEEKQKYIAKTDKSIKELVKKLDNATDEKAEWKKKQRPNSRRPEKYLQGIN